MSLEKLNQAKEKVVGVKETLRAIDEGEAKTIYIAKDADENIVKPLKLKCEEKQIDIVQVTSMKELGEAAGIEVKATSACIRD
ncbi:L7Ae/L30e/S12e/Gadd45 family ribosomal protein [Natranaerobius trueperi]|uniref:50S ribosomal protein L7Ae-like protein n=1 Tax=Natranaerobius trueperi TaxID=759412 RepID=A0A226BZT8_9FIRM|nr:ribosomal L7Ae/L30e/S12e/Gadd45 family protein [Natranaerobius trueperi]OWZ84496.1 50S ribosomal protein L7Ae-like protein [Natranaerobius trueperi]